MSSSWNIGRIAGIPVRVHWTFLILIGFVVVGNAMEGQTPLTIAVNVLFVLALFGCVVLHEMGHALAARRFGVKTTDITLLPIGGIARLERIPENPVQELVIALAGPIVNFVIAGLILLAGISVPAAFHEPHFLLEGTFFTKLLSLNLFLGLFNLLPAFPMDGGRVLRALLALKYEYSEATRMAANVGQFMAILFAVVGLLRNPMLLLIALFVWVGAEAEATMVQQRVALKGVRVRDAMLTDYKTLSPDNSLGQAAELLLAGSQVDFPVLSDGRAVGVLGRADLFAGLSKGGTDARVSEYQKSDLGVVEADEPLVPAMTRLRAGEGPCLQVVEAGHPVGLLTLENIGEFLMVRSALAGASRGGRDSRAKSYAS